MDQAFPGRLRLRFPALKKDPLRAARVCNTLRGIDGVLSVDASPVTGSMLIQYDTAAGRHPPFWASIEHAIALHQLHRTGAPAPPANALARQLSTALVERVLGRSALALVAALL